MDVEFLPLISRWAHIFAALVLVGGTVFLRWAIVPIMSDVEDQEQWFAPMRGRWSKLVMASVLFLLISGFYNATIKALNYELGGVYLAMLMIKIVLGFVIFYLVSVLSGRSQTAVKFRSAGAKWYNLTIVAMVLVVGLAGYMKSTPVKLKDKSEETTASIVENAVGPVDRG